MANTQTFDPDTATTRELEEHRWSGYRINTMTQDMELWCIGKVAAKRKMGEVKRNPKAMADMHEEAFATAGSLVIMPGGPGNGK